jgi:hypothetical protein
LIGGSSRPGLSWSERWPAPPRPGFSRPRPDAVARAARVHLGPEPSLVEARRRRDADPFDNLIPFEQLLHRT